MCIGGEEEEKGGGGEKKVISQKVLNQYYDIIKYSNIKK